MQVVKSELAKTPKIEEAQAFAEEILDFTARRFNGGSDALRLLVAPVENEDRWWDVLLDVVPQSDLAQTEYSVPTDASNWDACDAFAIVMQRAIVIAELRNPMWVTFREISLLDTPEEMRETAHRVFSDFDPILAEKAADKNAVVLLNMALLQKRAATDHEYIGKVICHEAVHLVEDASGLTLLQNENPAADFDHVTLDTFRRFRDEVGEDELKRRYPSLF